MLVSTAFHAALFVGLLALPYSPSLKPTTPALDVELFHRDAGTAPQASSRPAPMRSDAPAAAGADARPAAAGANTDLPPMAPPQPHAAPIPSPAPPAPPVSTVSRAAPPVHVDLSAVVADLARAVPGPRPARPALSAPQLPAPAPEQRRVNRKLAELAQRLTALGEDAAQPVSWTDHGERYTAAFTRVPAAGPMGIGEAVVEVSTERNGRRLSARMSVRRLAFSSYVQFIDRWDPGVWMHDDHIDGRFHSNTEINVDETFGALPSFNGKVTTAAGVDRANFFGPTRIHPKVFFGGLQTHVRRIQMPEHYVPFPSGSRPDPDRVQRLTEDTRIVFHADGSLTRQPLHGAGPGETRRLPDAPFYILGAADAEIDVSGIVNGQVLVYSPAKIVIAGNLTYAADPARRGGSDDYLGLVSDTDVEIAGPAVTGPGDLSVEAAIYAKRRFVVERFGTNRRATLHLYGSVTAGSLSATEPRFRTDLRFDRRFAKLRPPSFPLTDRYATPVWDGRWAAQPEDSAPSGANPVDATAANEK
jgi:hypothetical protein